jgi:hypothetical protein
VIAEFRRDLRTYMSQTEAEQARQSALERWRQANGVVRAHEQLGHQSSAAAADFDRALGVVYRDPAAARTSIEHASEQRGWSAVVEEIRRAPDTFGEIRGVAVAGRAIGERAEALRGVPVAAARAGDHLAARDLLRRSLPEFLAAHRTADESRAEAERRANQLHRHADGQELLGRMNRLMGELPPEHARELRSTLTQEQFGALKQAALGRKLGHDLGQER